MGVEWETGGDEGDAGAYHLLRKRRTPPNFICFQMRLNYTDECNQQETCRAYLQFFFKQVRRDCTVCIWSCGYTLKNYHRRIFFASISRWDRCTVYIYMLITTYTKDTFIVKMYDFLLYYLLKNSKISIKLNSLQIFTFSKRTFLV